MMFDKIGTSAQLMFALFICPIFTAIVYLMLRRPHTSKGGVATMVVFGSGGHTSEMLAMIKNLNAAKYDPIFFVIAHSDTTSRKKIEASELSYIHKVTWLSIHRSREVKQSWFTTIITTAIAIYQTFHLIFQYSPHLIICNGPGTCVPICCVAYLCGKLNLISPPKIVFAESFCRVKTLSLSGKILYYIADRFIVQWQELCEKYPKAQYIGKIC